MTLHVDGEPTDRLRERLRRHMAQGKVEIKLSTFDDWRRAGDQIAAACEGGRDEIAGNGKED